MGWLTGKKAAPALLPRLETGQGFIQVPPYPGARPGGDGAVYPDSSYESFARNGYGRNELIFSCIAEKAQSLPQSILRVYPDVQGDSLEDHPLRRLLANPNPVLSEFELFELSVTYLDIAGSCYWTIQRAIDGSPSELWPLRPDRIRIFPTTNPRVWQYGYALSPDSFNEDIVPIPRRDLIHFKYPNPLDPYFGQPPLRPAARATALDNAATDFVTTMLDNYAVPGVVVTAAGEVDEEVARNFKRDWKKAFSGSHRGEPGIVQSGMKVEPLGLTLEQLEFPDLRSVSETRICMALGVPPILIGSKTGLDRSTFTNYREARAYFWEETVFSLQRRFGDKIRQQLVSEFTGVGRRRVQTRWDNSDVLALREPEDAKWRRVLEGVIRGTITPNEGRAIINLPPVNGGDVLYVPSGASVTQITEQDPSAGHDAGQNVAAYAYAEALLAGRVQGRDYATKFLADRREALADTNGHQGVRTHG